MMNVTRSLKEFVFVPIVGILLLFALLVRLPYPLTNSFVFTFDHGKDSISVMHMVLTGNPKFVGPWTSIPGLFFGPGWYYLLAPFYVLSGFHPVGGVYAMIALLLAMVVITYKWLGKFEALIVATAPIWLTISTSAWNPFPLTATSLLVLIALLKLKPGQKATWQSMAVLGLASSLGFHFSSAFAVFYLPIVAVSLWLKRVKLEPKSFLALCVGFGIPFIPQLLFELKNNFTETRAVLTYFTSSRTGDALSLSKVLHVIQGATDTIRFSMLPEIRTGNASVSEILKVVFSLGFFASVLSAISKRALKKHQSTLTICFLFLLLPTVGLVFLHYNPWYLLGIAPAAVVLFGLVVRSLPRPLVWLWGLCFILTPVSFLYTDFMLPNSDFTHKEVFLRNKLVALETIRQDAGDQPFNSYHYEPAIYDYSYTYLYFYQAYQGVPLPSGFAYLPDRPTYIPDKSEILIALDAQPADATLEYYLVEEPLKDEFLKEWWQTLNNPQVEELAKVGSGITIYKRVN